MPWSKSDARRHTRKASTGRLAELWSKVANQALRGGSSEGSAVRQANAVVKKRKR